MAQLCNFGGSPSSGGSLSPQPYGQPSPTGQQPTGYVGFSPVQLPGQTPTLGQNQASPVQAPPGGWAEHGSTSSSSAPFGNAGAFGEGGSRSNAWMYGAQPSGPAGSASNPIAIGGYVDDNKWGQPSQGAAQGAAQGMGGVLGAMSPRPMSQRDIQMMARYLPGSGTTVDPNASPNALANRFGGNFRNMVPQHLQGRFDEMQRMAGGGGMGSYQDALNNPVIGAMIRRKGYL